MGESERANRTFFFASTLLCSITFQACFATRAKTHLLFPFVNNVQMRVRIRFFCVRLREQAAFSHADVVTFILAHLHVGRVLLNVLVLHLC